MIGVGLGLVLSKLIDITLINQLFPTLTVLTLLNITTSYISAKVIDEVYFNN